MREHSARDKILTVARRLFAKEGYEKTSTEAVLAESGVSRGALYHHFASKEKLFEAVLEVIEQELAAASVEASVVASDPAEALRLAFGTFLSRARQPEVRQIVLADAHSVLGWERWRALEGRYALGLIKRGLQAAVATGRLQEGQVEVVAHILLASLIEVAFLNAQGQHGQEDPDHRTQTLYSLLDAFLARTK